jgi:hypothetical protein
MQGLLGVLIQSRNKVKPSHSALATFDGKNENARSTVKANVNFLMEKSFFTSLSYSTFLP